MCDVVGLGLVEDGVDHGLAEDADEDILWKVAGAGEVLEGGLAGGGHFVGDGVVVDDLGCDELVFVLQGRLASVWFAVKGSGGSTVRAMSFNSWAGSTSLSVRVLHCSSIAVRSRSYASSCGSAGADQVPLDEGCPLAARSFSSSCAWLAI